MIARHSQILSNMLNRSVGSISNLLSIRNVSAITDSKDWTNLHNVVTELRNISRENGLEGDLPNTKLLKELGYGALVMAIRKKHGGIVEVAKKMGTHKDRQIVDIHKKVSARFKRRLKRKERLDKHQFY